VLLAISGAFAGIPACGRTGLGLLDNEVGNEGQDATLDSEGHVAVAEAGMNSPPCPKAPSSGSPAPSCAPGGAGMTNCGESGNESCCTSLEVCSGTFRPTYVDDGDGLPSTASLATISDFRLDKYSVTVGRFRPFVEAWRAGYYPPDGSGKHAYLNGGQGLTNVGPFAWMTNGYETGWEATYWNDTMYLDPTDANLTACSDDIWNINLSTWTKRAGQNENLPINCVTWHEAYAFCIWDGGFLPSGTEWEYAAVGGSQQRHYPWGSLVPGDACPGTGCEYDISGCNYPNGSGTCTGVGNVAPVGYASKGVGRWGQLDLGGNVTNWTMDVQWDNDMVCNNCIFLTVTEPESLTLREVGGGNFASDDFGALGFLDGERGRDFRTGIRCARAP
jgi:sulfatase modifying factor 1